MGYTGPQVTRRVHVNFSEQAYQTLEDLAAQTGKSMSEVLRDAISLMRYWRTVRAQGGRFLVERDGNIREVIYVKS